MAWRGAEEYVLAEVNVIGATLLFRKKFTQSPIHAHTSAERAARRPPSPLLILGHCEHVHEHLCPLDFKERRVNERACVSWDINRYKDEDSHPSSSSGAFFCWWQEAEHKVVSKCAGPYHGGFICVLTSTFVVWRRAVMSCEVTKTNILLYKQSLGDTESTETEQ